MPRTKRTKVEPIETPKLLVVPPVFLDPFSNNSFGQFESGKLKVVWGLREQGRDNMEDRLAKAEDDEHLVLGVFDGHGGHELAQYCAARVCTEVLEQGFDAVQTILDRVEKEFYATHIECVPCVKNKNVGTTVTVVVIQKQAPHHTKVAWLGDSRATAFDANNKRVWHTVDHDLYNEDEIKGVEARGGKIVGREMWYGPRIANKNGEPFLNMSRALGNADLGKWVGKTVQIQTLDLIGVTLIVATDGLWNSGTDFSKMMRAESLTTVRLAVNEFIFDDNLSFFIVKL